jgi:chromosome segregation ATPase
LQELNKEFYLFAGKWQPHMTQYATLDIDLMRKTISENKRSIEELKNKEESLEKQNKKLLIELNELKNQKAALEKEKTKLLPLEKYKEAVIDYMNNHYDTNKQWLSQDIEYEDEDDDDGNEIPMDSSIIDFFKAFHSNKVFMDEWEYNNVMESKEELNEYRIYKKVKGEMVSSGLDNSSIARHVKSIKNTINESKT